MAAGSPASRESLGQSIEVWDLSSRKMTLTLRTPHIQGITTFTWSPDGERIVTGGAGSIHMWDAHTGQPRQTIPVGAPRSVNGISFSPDGRRFAAGLGIGGRTAKIWDAQTGAELKTMVSRSGSVDEVIFDAKGSRLFTAGANSVRIWDASTGALLKTLSGHTAEVNTLELTRDGTRLITASEDGMMRVWDAQSGETLAVFVAVGGGGWMVYAPDGLFDGAADSFPRFGWRVRNAPATVSLSAFFNDFFYPGLLASVLSGERPKAQVDIGLALQVPGLHAMLESKLAHIETRGANLVLCFDAPPTALVPDLAAGGPLLANNTGEVTVDPADSTCKFQKVVGSKQNEQAARLIAWKPEPITTPWDGETSGASNSTLHVLAVGIDDYRSAIRIRPPEVLGGERPFHSRLLLRALPVAPQVVAGHPHLGAVLRSPGVARGDSRPLQRNGECRQARGFRSHLPIRTRICSAGRRDVLFHPGRWQRRKRRRSRAQRSQHGDARRGVTGDPGAARDSDPRHLPVRRRGGVARRKSRKSKLGPRCAICGEKPPPIRPAWASMSSPRPPLLSSPSCRAAWARALWPKPFWNRSAQPPAPAFPRGSCSPRYNNFCRLSPIAWPPSVRTP